MSGHVPAALPSPSRSGTLVETCAPALPRIAGVEVAVLDELDKVDPTTGELIPSSLRAICPPTISGTRQTRAITLRAARNEFVAFQMLLRGTFLRRLVAARAGLRWAGGKAIQVVTGRYHLVATKAGPLPDPIVPLSFPVEAVPRVKGQSLHVELFIPHSQPAGLYRGTLTLKRPTTGQALRCLSLQVWDFALPDHLSFLPEMNCYGLPENERDYYRLAHKHRTVLNRVPYNQNGRMQEGCAPRWDKDALDFDWRAWDPRFAPLLDGTAFADLPRKNVPVECFYLPLHENWPSPMEGNYRGGYWADQVFPESYRRSFVAAARQIAAHAQAKHWTETLFQGFLNNKNIFKARGWSRGSSPWLLDEPANFQDYWVLRYFAVAFHQGINQASGTRADRLCQHPSWSFAPTSRGRNGVATVSTACSTTMWSAVPCELIRGWSSSASAASVKSCWSTARPIRSRRRTSSRSAGASMPGHWVPTASSPGRPLEPPSHGIGPTSCRYSIRDAAPGPMPVQGRFHPFASRPFAADSRTSSISRSGRYCATSRGGPWASRCARH